jgi:TM2 domain-containing membrane protein YozV
MFCVSCGAQVADNAAFCPSCGSRTNATPPAGTPAAGTPPAPDPFAAAAPAPAPVPVPGAVGAARKSKIAAALLGIFLGVFGIHRFYLGYTTIGIIQLALGLGGILTCGITSIASAIWGLVDGIMILTGSINRDAQGQPLAD